MVRKIEFQCKELVENKKKSTAAGQSLSSALNFIDTDANADLTFKLSVTGHPDEVKAFQNDVSIMDVDEFFEASFKVIPKTRQSKLLEAKRPSKEIAEEDKIDLDEDPSEDDLID